MVAFSDEKDVLKTLEKIKGNVETGITLKKYQDLIADAQVEINIFKRDSAGKEKFLKAAEASLGYYQYGEIFWEMKNINDKTNNATGYRLSEENKTSIHESWQKASEQLDKAYSSLNTKSSSNETKKTKTNGTKKAQTPDLDTSVPSHAENK